MCERVRFVSLIRGARCKLTSSELYVSSICDATCCAAELSIGCNGFTRCISNVCVQRRISFFVCVPRQ